MLLLTILKSIPFLAVLTELVSAATCSISPLGDGQDDTEQVLQAINDCGTGGKVVLNEGNFNITRKMKWNLSNAEVDLFGILNFNFDIDYWLNMNNTYQVVFIQSQSSWFVLTGNNFVVDAHETGGIQGNGQMWWEYFTSHTRQDGDGRPLSLTVFEAENALVKDFKIDSPPFWCNCVANSKNVVYDGMICNATNTNPNFFGTNIVPNTDGIDTYRSDNIRLLNWDVSTGDDCIAIKGNSTNILAQNITCHGGNGIAFGSLGQYVELIDEVANVTLEDIKAIRTDPSVQPDMEFGVYFKSWSATVNGSPPVEGGGGLGFTRNVTARRFRLSGVDTPVAIVQTYGATSNSTPSFFQFEDFLFEDFSGTADTDILVNLNCSVNAPCPNMSFRDFNVTPLNDEAAQYDCTNAKNVTGLPSSACLSAE